MEIGPQCQKELNAQHDAGIIGDFMDWLAGEGYSLYTQDEDGDENVIHIPGAMSKLLYRYYDIDERELEREKRAILRHYQDQAAMEELTRQNKPGD